MDSSDVAATRVHRFLAEEPVVWLSSVRPDGGPHLVPIWFWWDGSALLVFSKPHARKVDNMRSNPAVMLALGDADEDFDVALVEARGELLDVDAAAVLPPAMLAKYAARMAAIGLTATEFARTYSQVLRIVPTRYLPWHGRTTPRSARIEDPRTAHPIPTSAARSPRPALPSPRPTSRSPRPRSIPRPRRPSVGRWLEPLVRGLRGGADGRPHLVAVAAG
jgi:PPOX class probable F420-dependent enzyme